MSKDEILAEAIRKYPVIYDKGRKGHKDKNMVANAWANVVKECDLEDVASAQRLFANLKKRFNKRRKDVKVRGPSGSGATDVSDAKAKFKELDYLAWLEPYVILRETKTNCPDFKRILNTCLSDEAEDSYDKDETDRDLDANAAIAERNPRFRAERGKRVDG